MPSTPQTSLTEILLRLLDERVAFILVGGLAAVSQGAPVTTYDVDIVHARASDNVARLFALLTSIRLSPSSKRP